MRDYILGNADDEVFGDFAPSEPAKPVRKQRTALELDRLILEAAENTLRAEAMGAVLTWLDDGEWSADALESILEGMAYASDDDDDWTDDELAHFESLLDASEGALTYLGGDARQVSKALDGDDAAAEALGEHLSEILESNTKSDDDLISEFAAGGEFIGEAVEAVIRNGERVLKRKKTRKRRMTAAQRAALKKAQRKAHTAGAKRARAKSMRIRKQRGMD